MSKLKEFIKYGKFPLKILSIFLLLKILKFYIKYNFLIASIWYTAKSLGVKYFNS